MKTPLFKPYFPEDCRRRILADVDEILTTGKLMLGAHKDALEAGFAQLCGVPHAVSVNTCTTALTLCLKYFGAEGHDVLVQSGSFLTSVSSVLFAGGRPVLVDLNPATLGPALDDLERKITPQTKGLVWVHLTGIVSPEYEAILEFARSRGLFVIEDCAHALGAEVAAGRAGSLGDAGCFSFYPTKIITSGTGGMVTTADPELKSYVELMRLFCRHKDGINCVGNDWFLDEIRCCVARHHLAELDAQLARRREIAALYDRELAGVPGITLLSRPADNLPSFYQYPVFLDLDRDHAALLAALKAREIEAKKIYDPVHRENAFRHLDKGGLERTDAALGSSVCLPLFVEMGDDQVRAVAGALKAELNP